MIILIFCLLCLSGSNMAVFMGGLDCSLNCECCKGGVSRCTNDARRGDNYCFEGCVDGIYGLKCRNLCKGKCSTCENVYGIECYSCKDTFYDINGECSKSCPVGCEGGVCNDDGTCKTCTAHFEGTTCSECQSGYYGANCNVSCSVGCVNGQCSKDGTCLCRPNFVTSQCDKCQDGRYGVNCDQVCSVGCSTPSCDRNNGFCMCLPNFTGDKCEQCIVGLYDESCNLNCSGNCKVDECSRYHGKCTHGCVDGCSGDNCTAPCANSCATCQQYDKSHCVSCYNGNSGSTCQCLRNCNCDFASDICSTCKHGYANPEHRCECQFKHCMDDLCNKCVNQTFYVDKNSCCDCPDTCKDGVCRSGPICTSGCIDGFYGIDCSQSCLSLSADCLRCSQTDGRCLECRDSFFAHTSGSCNSCSRNCKNKQCNYETGACTNGCAERFWGNKCENHCGSNCVTCQLESGICVSCTDATFHGLFCNESCSTSCLESKCEQMTGYCYNGCSRDSFGSMCDIKCPGNCQQGDTKTRCNIVGDCLYGCITGLEGRDCTERRIYLGSSTIAILAVLSGTLGILLICIATGCYVWNRRMSKSIEQSSEIRLGQREIERTYEQLQRQPSVETDRNIDDNYTVLSI